MTLRLHTALLLGCAALLLLAPQAEAQVRADNSLYIAARVGVGAYGGDIDGVADGEFGDYFDQLGLGFGGEIGYQFSPSLALGVLYHYGSYPGLEEFEDRPDFFANDGDVVQHLEVLFRYVPFSNARLSPFVLLGGGFTLSTPDPLRPSTNDADSWGAGPVAGLGLDLVLGSRLSLFTELKGFLVMPDDAVDNNNPGENNDGDAAFFNTDADDMDFDILGYGGIGLRLTFAPAITKVDATIDGPTSLLTGESGTYTAFVNDDATGPCEYTWDWGDGQTATGLTATHMYAEEGTYTVTFSAACKANTDVETLLVTVTAPPPPPVEAPALANCTATPSEANLGEAVRFSATVTGTQPITFAYDFGDGSSANTLTATHTYAEEGEYTVTLRASNEAGSDQCTFVVNVVDRFCAEVSDLNTVYFDYGASSLTADAQGRLAENIEVLERCPNLCVVVSAYTDDRESDKLRLSERRAGEVKAYYMENGIDDSRIVSRGLGEAPDSNSKEDPGPGDRNARRAESAPVDCDELPSDS
ncbi:MAG: PKD domain-containing protein [Bacteroidota bacterium]